MNKLEQIQYIEDNFPLTTRHTSKRRTRHDFFTKINTEVQAYLLGFYAADGGLNEKRKTFRIHLNKNDSEIIYLYKDLICPDARVFTREETDMRGVRDSKSIHCNGTFGVDINSTVLCNALVNLGFGYNKTYTENHLPQIDKSLLRHFIRGYFDGDGSISGWYIPQDIKYKKNERFRIHASICCKTATLLEDIKNLFAEYNIKSKIFISRRDDMYILSIPSSQIKKLFDLLYQDSNFYLSRKYKKFNYYANTEVSQLIAEHRNA